MALHRDMASIWTKKRVASMIAALTVVALSLVLSGCVVGGGTPLYTDTAVGTVRVSQGIVASTTVDAQRLDEYGIFYSTNRDDVAYIEAEGYPYFINIATIVTNPDVKQIRVITGVDEAPGAVGTLTVDAKKLTPGTTYYYRFYTLGHEKDGTTWRTLFDTGSHKTSNPTLKSLTKSAGTLSPAFAKLKYSYTDTLSAGTSSSKITVVPALSNSKVRMRIDAGAWSSVRNKVVSVSKGASKTLYIEVTAADGGVANYTVRVVRKK